MAAYTDLFDLAYAPTYPDTVAFSPLMKKVAVAVAASANAVLVESSGTTNHTNRLNWAKNSLRNVQAAGQTMMWAVLQDAGVQSSGDSTTDAAVQSVVDGLVDSFANV